MIYNKDFKLKTLDVNILLKLLIQNENEVNNSNFITQDEMFDNLEMKFFRKFKR